MDEFSSITVGTKRKLKTVIFGRRESRKHANTCESDDIY